MQLYGRLGWGSAIIESQLAWYGIAYDYVQTGDLLADAAARDALAPVNPIAQVPALRLPDGQIWTESAAITVLLAEQVGSDDLVPAAGSPERAGFLRWLVFLVANIYPTFTYADVPTRFVAEAAAAGFRNSVDAYALRLWSAMEAAAVGPWFLGERISAIDIYLSVMTRWRPKRAWFVQSTPRLAAAAQACDQLPVLRTVWQRNFPESTRHS